MLPIDSAGDLVVRWVHPDPGAPTADAAALAAALEDWTPPPGDGFAFVAAEQAIVKPARRRLEAVGHDLDRAVVKGYWKRGEAEYHAPH